MSWLKKFSIYCALSALGGLAFLSSCNIINPAEPVPMYLQVNGFGFHTDTTQGSSSSKFTDVWVTVDGLAQGAYEMPAKFPLLFSGTHTLHLSAGIMLNGMAGARSPYTVLNSFDTTINFTGANITAINPVTTYSSTTHFAQMEDFDHSGFTLKRSSGKSDTTIIDTLSPDAFEGKYGAVFLDDNHQRFQYESVDKFYLPGNNTPCYVELNYKCNNEFDVGTIAHTQAGIIVTPILTVRTTDTWKKIYVNLTPTVSGNLSATGWKIYLYALKSNGQSTAYIYFDNIKVLY